MEIERIDHIHFISKDHDKTRAAFEAITGRKPLFFHDYTPEAGVIVSFWNFPCGFQILAVSDKEKAWGDWLLEAEEGIHTISMLVRNIEKCIPEMEAMGYKMIHDTVAASGGVREVTFDTTETFGFFVELMEYVIDFRQ